jgi:hydrogenase maturation protease
VRTAVVGVGNPARGDDAAGLHVARLVRARLAHRADVDVHELWAGGLRLAETLAGYDRAVIVDAMTRGRAPGTVEVLAPGDLGPGRHLACQHDASLPAALELLRCAGEAVPARLVLVGIEAAATDVLTEALSPAVQAALAHAADEVVRLAEDA